MTLGDGDFAHAVNVLCDELDMLLQTADAELARQFPGRRGGRQPVHTVYVAADRHDERLVPMWGEQACALIDEHASLYSELVNDDRVCALVRHKLAAEPVEDLRIDFEDGYGMRADDAEDADAVRAATALARSQAAGSAPPMCGIRVKSLEAPTRRRAVRTLLRFLERLGGCGASLDGFVVTLPKVTSVDQVEAMVMLCERAEQVLGIEPLRFELQIEMPQAILGPDGTSLVARMVHVADGRCIGLHYGTYDYSAYCGIAAPYQAMDHPVADYAKLVMQAAAAGTGVRLSDGSSNLMPVGDAAAVRRGWAEHLRLVRRSLERGYYQGWDLHPHQLPTRFAATFAFYRQDLVSAAARLRDYLTSRPTAILDEPATARALTDYLRRALDCGASSGEELRELAGLDAQTLALLGCADR